MNSTKKNIAIQKIKAKYRKKRLDLLSRRDEFVNWFKEKVESKARDWSDEKAEELWEKRSIYLAAINQKLNKLIKLQNQEIDVWIQKNTGLTPKKVTMIVTASAIIALSIKFADSIRRDAREECFRIDVKKKRQLCIKRFQEQYYKKRLAFLRDHLTHCRFAKDPVLCHDMIDKEILRVQARLEEVKEEVLEKYTEVKS